MSEHNCGGWCSYPQRASIIALAGTSTTSEIAEKLHISRATVKGVRWEAQQKGCIAPRMRQCAAKCGTAFPALGSRKWCVGCHEKQRKAQKAAAGKAYNARIGRAVHACQRKGCANTFNPSGGQKYCGPECAEIVRGRGLRRGVMRQDSPAFVLRLRAEVQHDLCIFCFGPLKGVQKVICRDMKCLRTYDQEYRREVLAKARGADPMEELMETPAWAEAMLDEMREARMKRECLLSGSRLLRRQVAAHFGIAA